jgi:hypothetical protein
MMSGLITFASNAWAENSSRTRFVFDFLIGHLPDGPKKAELTELEENNVLLLGLDDPSEQVLVDLLADELPQYIEQITDNELREAFRPALTELAEMAKVQRRDRQRTPHTPSEPEQRRSSR